MKTLYTWWDNNILQKPLFSVGVSGSGSTLAIASTEVSTSIQTLDLAIRVFGLIGAIIAVLTGVFSLMIAYYKWKNRRKIFKEE